MKDCFGVGTMGVYERREWMGGGYGENTSYAHMKIEQWNLLKLFSKEEGWERVIDRVNFIKVHYMHVWKYQNETPLSN
jgi:hypothetical protein